MSLMDGGEGGIRTLSGPVDSVTYRFHVAACAMNAAAAAAPCTPLHPAPWVSDPIRVGRGSARPGPPAAGVLTAFTRGFEPRTSGMANVATAGVRRRGQGPRNQLAVVT
jgi:hypothetical protein